MAKLYSTELKGKMVAKLLQPGGPTIPELSKEVGISKTALYNWMIAYKQLALGNGTTMEETNISSVRPQNWSAEAKLTAVNKISSMTEEDIGIYCRQNGIYSSHLEQWNELIIDGLKPSANKEQRLENLKLKAQIKELKSDLYRKDKALAETSALLVLKKKANLIWGDGKDD
jgi:transposase-like protein